MSEESPNIDTKMLDDLPAALAILDADKKIIYANTKLSELLGLEQTDLRNTPFRSLCLVGDEASVLDVAGDIEQASGKLMTTKSGRIIRLEISKISSSDAWYLVATPTGGTILCENAAEDWIENEDFLGKINGAVWRSKIGTESFSKVSASIYQLTGYTVAEWQQDDFWKTRIHPDDSAKVLRKKSKALKAKSAHKLKYRILARSGEIIWIREHIEVSESHGDTQLYMRGLMLDVSESEKSRLLLDQSRNRFEALISQAPFSVSVYDSEGTLQSVNDTYENYWDIDLKKQTGKFNLFKSKFFRSTPLKSLLTDAFQGNKGEKQHLLSVGEQQQEKRWFSIKYYPIYGLKNKLDSVVLVTEDIHDIKTAENEIKAEEAIRRIILDALNDAIIVVDPSGIIVAANREFTDLTRPMKKSVGMGDSMFDFIATHTQEEYLKEKLGAVLSKKTQLFDVEIKLGNDQWYRMRITHLEKLSGAMISYQNINTRKEIETALERSLRKYRNIYNKAPVMMHSLSSKLEVISVSDFWLEKTGYERNEVIGKPITNFLNQDSASKIHQDYTELERGGGIKNASYQYRKKSGEQMDVLLSAVAEQDHMGRFERSIAGMIDISDLKKAERKLQESQARLLESQRISKIAEYEYSVDAKIFYPSEDMMSMMGLKKQSLSLDDFHTLIYKEDESSFRLKFTAAIENKQSFFHIFRINHVKSKQLKWISGRGKTVLDKDNQVVKVVGTVQDITEQKTAESKIRKLQERALLATEIAGLGVWEYDQEQDELTWEDQMFMIFADRHHPITAEELPGIFPKDELDKLLGAKKLIKKGVSFIELEFSTQVHDETKYLRSFTRILRNQTGQVRGMIGVIYDITSDKQLQSRLESSLEEKNVLIREVHHRVKNNMQLISSIMALKSYDLGDVESKKVFDNVNERIKAMAIIHDKLYKYYNVSEIDISDYLRQLADELRVIQGQSEVDIVIDADRLMMDVDKALLIGLIISELVGNAIKHGLKDKKDGKIYILLRKQEEINELTVSNNGAELPEGILESSTGLGISLIKTFVNQMKGTLSLDGKQGFKVNF